MIELLPTKTDNTIAFSISGKIDTNDFDRVANAIKQKLTTYNKLRVYAEVNSFDGISLKAFLKDLQFSFQHLKNFEKEAIVSEKEWLQKLVSVSDKLFPSIEVKHFSFAEKDKALDWILRDDNY
jgi:predicted component of type VI protein secretion system